MARAPMQIHKRISALRTPVVLAFFGVATAHHLIMEQAPVEWRLVSQILVYGLGAAGAAWILLGWLARSVRRAEQASQRHAEAAARLARRNRQIEALYTAGRLLAGARGLTSVAEPVLDLAMRIADARAGALVLYGDGDGAPVVVRRGEPEDVAPLPRIVAGGATEAPCLACGDGTRCGLPAGWACLPIVAGTEVLGLLRLCGAASGAATRQSLNTLVGEMVATWWARRTEGRALTAFREIGHSFRSRGDVKDALVRFVELMRGAMGAEAGALYRRDGAAYALEAASGPAPAPPGRQVAAGRANVWSEQDGRVVYATADGVSLVALSFLGQFPTHAPDMGVLRVIAAQAAFLMQLTATLSGLVWQERQRLAGELHDGLAQTLAYLNLHTRRAIESHRDGRSLRLVRILDEMAGVTLEAYDEVRKTIDDLRLRPRKGEGAAAFFERMAAGFAARERVAVDVHVPPDLEAMPGVVAEIARFLQEALNNAVRHGQADTVVIRLAGDGDGYLLSVRDNGHGFDPGAASLQGRHGLTVMRERMTGLGGRFTLESRPGGGTTVRARLPAAAIMLTGDRQRGLEAG